MRYLIIFFTTLCAQANAKDCVYPAAPINWVLRYCGYEIATDDEIAIQNSECFQAAASDITAKNKCKMNEKYKSKLCQKFLLKDKKYPNLKTCLNSPDVKPFFAGE